MTVEESGVIKTAHGDPMIEVYAIGSGHIDNPT